MIKRDRLSPIGMFDFLAFHTPNYKLVNIYYGRLLYNDFLRNNHNVTFRTVPSILHDISFKKSLNFKDVEIEFFGLSQQRFQSRVESSIQGPKSMCKHVYC